jgi:hypothetical protein
MVVGMYFMVHNLSIDYSCSPNELLSKELCPLEVNWCRNFTLTVSVVTFSYKFYFLHGVACLIPLSNLFCLIFKDKITPYSCKN